MSQTSQRLLLVAILTLTMTGCEACGTDVREDPSEMGGENNRFMPDINLPPNSSSGMDLGDEEMSGEADMASAPADMLAPQEMGSPGDMTPGQDMSGADMGGADMGGEDMSMDMFVAPGCVDLLKLNQTFDIEPAGPKGQLFSRVAFDGDGVWIVYNRRETAMSGKGDIYATRLTCDGGVDIAPFKVNSSGADANDYHPNLAIRGEDLYIVWSRDQDGANFPVMRAYRTDGMPHAAQESIITPQAEATPLSNLIWETDVAALPNGEAAFTASFASEKAGTFQIVVQRVDRMGNLVGPALEAFEEKGVDQTRPSITSLTDGTLYVSWSRYKAADAMAGTPEEPHRVVYTRFGPGATEPDQAGPFPAQPGASGDNQLSRYSKERTTDGKVYLAFQLDSTGANDILVKDGTFGAPNAFGTIDGDKIDLRPSVAGKVEGGGGAIAWYRADPSPVANSVHVQAFSQNGGQFTLDQRITIPTSDPARPPYGPGIAHISGDVYMITWSEGSSTGVAEVKARFVSL